MDLTQEKVVQMCGRCLKKTVDVYGHRFVLNSTRQGDIFRSACPVNHKSTFVSWTCRHDSTWDAHPDLSVCRGNTALFPVPAGSTTLGPLENITTLINNIQNVDLYPAEAVTVLEGVAELQRKFQEEDLEKNFDAADRGSFFRSVVDVAANVLREPMSFEVNNAARGRMLSSAQDLLTNSSLRFGERLQPNTAVTYKQEGVHVFVEKRPAAHFREERNRLLLHEYSHTTSILLPEDFYDGYETAENGDQFVLVQKTTYRDLHTRYNRNLSNIDIDLTGYIDYKSVVNSHVIGVTVGSGKWEATSDQLVHINSSHNYYGESLRLSNIKCVWWDSSGDDWSTEGCSLNWTTAEYSVCHCDHLTSFALIMDIYGYRPPKSSSQATEELVLHLISEIGSCVSILCLVLTILSTRIVMLAKKSQRQDRSTKPDLTMIHLCLCLCLFFCLFLPRVTAKTSEELCITITFFRHYFLMATFTWNAVWSVFLFLGIIQVLSKITVTTKQILIAGYFLPLVIVVFSLVLSICLEIYARKDVCWIAPGFALWSFIGAISIILLVNLVIYVKVVRVMWTRSHPTTYNDRAKLRGSVSIFLGLGLTWSVGWFLMLEESPSFYLKIIFNLLNSLQGVGIFLLNVPLHGKNWKLIKGFIDNWMKTRGYQCWTSLETQDLRLDEINSGYKRYMGSRFTTETSLKDTEDSDKE
ncbi:adhesion G protein-coupled receptor L3-like [Macrobrachium rosenbergii]|uniref:adhesion G protein-coupled receptor L3-like n=1 Tax=Macrobrachium rosenbergii TaxID=79674 RepID=UPI0034D77732